MLPRISGGGGGGIAPGGSWEGTCAAWACCGWDGHREVQADPSSVRRHRVGRGEGRRRAAEGHASSWAACGPGPGEAGDAGESASGWVAILGLASGTRHRGQGILVAGLDGPVADGRGRPVRS